MKVKIKHDEDTVVTSLNGVGQDDDTTFIFVDWYEDHFLPISDVEKLEYWCNGKWNEVELWEDENSRRNPDEIFKELEKLYLRG